MKFDPHAYGPVVAGILKLDGAGSRLMPLASGRCCSPEALAELESLTPALLFPKARRPEAAMSGLYLYFSCLDQSHEISQSIDVPEGSYWHGVMHRQEPDSNNAKYWFRKVPSHPIFAELAAAAQKIGIAGGRWDPSRFVDLCEQARREPGSDLERMALEMQRAEWQLMFDYCAREGSGAL